MSVPLNHAQEKKIELKKNCSFYLLSFSIEREWLIYLFICLPLLVAVLGLVISDK